MSNFYEFNQNNSGGSFDTDENLCHTVIIEANSEDEAVKKAEDLGCYWDGCANGIDCPCCGDRWYNSPDTIDYKNYSGKSFETLEEWCQYMANKYGWTSPDARIFYLDGRKVEIFMPEK